MSVSCMSWIVFPRCSSSQLTRLEASVFLVLHIVNVEPCLVVALLVLPRDGTLPSPGHQAWVCLPPRATQNPA